MTIDATKGVRPLRPKALPAELRHALIEARQKCGWSQRDLASRLRIGQRHISGIESGKIVPRYDTLLELVRILDRDLLMVPRALVPAVRSLIRDQGDPEESRYADDGEQPLYATAVAGHAERSRDEV